MCMSRRTPQPLRPRHPSSKSAVHFSRIRFARLIRHLRDGGRVETLQKSAGIRHIEIRISSFYAQEETVPSDKRELRNVEHRMIRSRQSVHGQHADSGSETAKQNRQLE